MSQNGVAYFVFDDYRQLIIVVRDAFAVPVNTTIVPFGATHAFCFLTADIHMLAYCSLFALTHKHFRNSLSRSESNKDHCKSNTFFAALRIQNCFALTFLLQSSFFYEVFDLNGFYTLHAHSGQWNF